MTAVQLFGITPDELKSIIEEGVKSCLENLSQAKQNTEQSNILTRKKTAELLGVDISTLHNWTKKGILIAHGIGGRVYYKRSEIEHALIKLN